MDVVDAFGRLRQRWLEWRDIARNATPDSYYAFSWHGAAIGGGISSYLPDGRYRIVVSALRALGNEENETHWERWESPLFRVDRPCTPAGRSRCRPR